LSVESKNDKNNNNKSIMKWLNDEIGDGENGIVIYPTLQTFRQIYTKYVKEQLVAGEENDDDNNKKTIVKAMNNLSKESSLLQLFTKQPTA
jgi:hypothetical protein